MKALAIAFCLVSLVACGNKSSGKSKDDKERGREEQCTNEASSACADDYFVSIVSNKLPSKTKITFADNEYSFDIVNECDPDQAGYVGVVREASVDLVEFGIVDAPASMLAHLRIADLGINCDQEEVVFDAWVNSVVENPSEGNNNKKLTYTINI